MRPVVHHLTLERVEGVVYQVSEAGSSSAHGELLSGSDHPPPPLRVSPASSQRARGATMVREGC